MAAKKKLSRTVAVLEELRAYALAFPGAHTKSPWPNHLDAAVKEKTFAYLPERAPPLTMSVKLPSSSGIALMLPFAKPTPYGLGKSGWVSVSFEEGEDVPVEMLKEWIDESYRAVAPKKLAAQVGAGAKAAAPKKSVAPKKKAAAKKKK